MKNKFIALFFVICASSVFAAEVQVHEVEIPGLSPRETLIDTRFFMDTTTNQGHVQLSVSEFLNPFPPFPGPACDPFGRCFPTPFPQREIRLIHKETVAVEGLTLVGDKVMFENDGTEVECGILGVSRVFRIPTIFLNGNCKLSGKVVGPRANSKVVVTLTTKEI